MAAAELELRVMALEAEMTQVKKQLEKAIGSQEDWLDAVYGAFANDPHFEEAMRLGREYRESLRPRAAGKPARSTGKRAVKKGVIKCRQR
jgi:hypothetical protein